jgi:hypothetical protein
MRTGCGEGKHAYEGKATGGVTRGHFATAFIQTLRTLAGLCSFLQS